MPPDDDPFGSVQLPPKEVRQAKRPAPAVPAPPAAPAPRFLPGSAKAPVPAAASAGAAAGPVEADAAKAASPPQKKGSRSSIGPKSKVTSRLAHEICKQFALGVEAGKLLMVGMTTREYLDILIARGLYDDATRFLAHALPKREAVWWACQCARAAYGSQCPPAAEAAVQAAEAWAQETSEDHRQTAMSAAEAADFGTPAGCAAAAAFWSGGSLAPPHLPPLPPAEHLTARGVSGSVLLSANLDPEGLPEKFRCFLTLGIAVANGSNRWKTNR